MKIRVDHLDQHGERERERVAELLAKQAPVASERSGIFRFAEVPECRRKAQGRERYRSVQQGRHVPKDQDRDEEERRPEALGNRVRGGGRAVVLVALS